MYFNKIGFIGCGNIASAIIGGSLSSGYIKSENLVIFDTDSDKITPYVSMGVMRAESVSDLVLSSDVVFLTIKPQVYESVLKEIAPYSDGVCFVSVAAGITLNYIKGILGQNAHVIRVMPNTPLLYGKGASAIVNEKPVTDEEFLFVKGFFDASGVSVEVPESQINTVTAISGSAPAYFMRVAKDFIDFAVKSGMTEKDATILVLQTLSGSAEMIKLSDSDIDTLIKNVTSPNGTTQAGLSSLDNDSFDRTINDCLKATVKRATELTK